MDDDISFGAMLPTGENQWGEGADPRDLIDFAVRAEGLGYDSLWVNDSLLSPRVEALTMLAAATPVTDRVTLGTATLLPVLRRPVQAAQALASIDLLSGGRLTVAVGAGFPGRFGRPLYDLSEVPWDRRFARLDETVALWRHLWTSEGVTSFQGEFLRFEEIPAATVPYRKGGPPVWLGGATPAALARTGRLYDGWLPYPPESADYRTGLARVRRASADAGRPSDAITPALFVVVLIADSVELGRRELEGYSTATYGLPLEELETVQAVVTGPPEHVAARLGGYVDAGARHLVCRIGALHLRSQREQLQQIADLFPLVRHSR
jgi:alkanesulfonate monooxygenase SsuD/methylene tetrahydromethanopterin reductase-like flavin-dependent oxidoreductase (luciferase family)